MHHVQNSSDNHQQDHEDDVALHYGWGNERCKFVEGVGIEHVNVSSTELKLVSE